MKRNILMISCLVTVSLVGLLAVSAGAMAPPKVPVGDPPRDVSLSPHPATWDQITHNVGEIATTVDNFGYIGGYWHYNMPSGEFPRNSGHHYLAEIRFWMGGVTASGDTLVANTADDFQAIENPGMLDNPYKILLSSDTSRFYQGYDAADTVGLASGNPAYGWRVWDPADATWQYNEVYNSLAADFRPGGPTSLQDSHLRFGDGAGGSSLMGLEVTQTGYCWNYCYNEDFLFIALDITNTSAQDYSDFAVGLYIDIDVGGPDGTGENGRLGDLVAFDSLENLAWIYDQDHYDEGWRSNTGIMGTKLLQTPDDIGMTAFRTDDWAFLPDNDPGRYALINSAQFDPSLPPTDQFYVQCTRGIDLTAGKTVRVVFALVAGEDEEDFMTNAQRAQELYDNNFVGPEPPPTPVLTVNSGDGEVFLTWTDTSEVATDPLSGDNDFIGYKLYRSDDRGVTWGERNYREGNDCRLFDYERVTEYRVNNPGDPIPHAFRDTGLTNGVEYWYCLAAYDNGDSTLGIAGLQNGFGTAGEVTNVVSVIPLADPAGYYDPSTTVEKLYTGSKTPADGDISVEVFDSESLLGSEFRVVFEDRPEDTYWHLVNEVTGDTVIANQTDFNAVPEDVDPVEGLRVTVTNPERYPEAMVQTEFAGSDTTMAIAAFYGEGLTNFSGMENYIFSEKPYRATYELRYTGDSSYAVDLLSGMAYWVGLEAWNVDRNERVTITVLDLNATTAWEPTDLVLIVDYPYDPGLDVFGDPFPFDYSWLVGFDPATYSPSAGDVLTIEGAPMHGPDDAYTFAVGISASAASAELKDIKVYPNPYYAHRRVADEVKFINLPQECTIRIYTLAGDLVQTIEHNEGRGEAGWDLLSSNMQQVASGIYLYHIESEFGEYLGRFAVVK